ncbi:MAG: ABC transporter permease, partial [Acidobacteriota bacterium]
MKESSNAARGSKSGKVWRLLLILLPRHIRREHGAEILSTIQRRTRRAFGQDGLRGMLRLWALEAADLLGQALRLRVGRCLSRLRKGFRHPPSKKGEQLMQSIAQDLRFALRSQLRNPGTTIVVLLTLALSVGVNTAIFSVVRTVLLEPLPYDSPDRLVRLYETNREMGWEQADVAPANFLDWQEQSRAFEHLAVIRGRSFNLTGGDEPRRVLGVLVAGDLFTLLGVQPFLGRPFTPQEYQPDADLAVIVSHTFWVAQLGADRRIVGRQVVLNQQPARIVGVLPRDFRLIQDLWAFQEDIWIPLSLDAGNRGWHGLRALGRLKAGASISQAQAEMDVIAAGLAEARPESNGGWGIRLIPFHESMVGQFRKPLYLLFASVGMVLLIACVNLALLMLARAFSRRREVAVRIALGAGRSRLIRQALCESMLHSLAGGALGLVVSYWILNTVLAFAPHLPRLDSDRVAMDMPLLAFALLASATCGSLFGALPAWQAWRGAWQGSLQEGGRAQLQGGGPQRMPGFLMMAEVALAVVLLVGTGLLIRSLHQTSIVEPGFDADNLLTFTMIPRYNYPELERQAAFITQVLERVRALPGVESAAEINFLPFSGHDAEETIEIQEVPESAAEAPRSAHFRAASPGYFRTMRIPLRAGRSLTEADLVNPRVALVNQRMAEQFWPGQDPIGKHIRRRRQNADWLEVVGVVADVRHHGLDRPSVPEFYVPYSLDTYSTRTIVLRTWGDPNLLAGAVRQQVRLINPDQSIFDLMAMQGWLSDSLRQARFLTISLGILTGVAWVMAAVGIYGVLSWGMNQRRHEIGVRKALGAGRRGVFRLALVRGLAPAVWGIALGLAAALGMSQMLSNLLYGVSARDPWTFGAV